MSKRKVPSFSFPWRKIRCWRLFVNVEHVRRDAYFSSYWLQPSLLFFFVAVCNALGYCSTTTTSAFIMWGWSWLWFTDRNERMTKMRLASSGMASFILLATQKKDCLSSLQSSHWSLDSLFEKYVIACTLAMKQRQVWRKVTNMLFIIDTQTTMQRNAMLVLLITSKVIFVATKKSVTVTMYHHPHHPLCFSKTLQSTNYSSNHTTNQVQYGFSTRSI